MLSGRISQDSRNTAVKTLRQPKSQSNVAWIRKAEQKLTQGAPKVLLLGGTGLVDFRIRVAQSHARADLLPSFWSHVTLLTSKKKGGLTLWHVPLDLTDGVSSVPSRNGIVESDLSWCADKVRFRNMALLEFPGAEAEQATKSVNHLLKARLSHDFVSPMLEWFGFAWAASSCGNPLLAGTALPSATFVESVYASADIDLAPGMADRTLCPEAIWQAAKWWKGFYASDAGGGAPKGVFSIGQEGAAIVE